MKRRGNVTKKNMWTKVRRNEWLTAFVFNEVCFRNYFLFHFPASRVGPGLLKLVCQLSQLVVIVIFTYVTTTNYLVFEVCRIVKVVIVIFT